MLKLREYQEILIEGVREEFRTGKRRTCVVAPCGAGKTVIMAWMAAQSATRGQQVLFAVHRQELVDQSSETFRALGINHGIIAAGYSPSSEAIQIGMIQTVVRRLSKIEPPNLIIIDESHHILAKTYIKVMEAFPNAYVIGLTATPARMGGQGLGDVFQSLIMGPSVKQLIEWGNLSPFRYYAPPVKADLTKLRVKFGEYVKSEVALEMNQSEIIGDCIEHYNRLCPGKRAIVYCAGIAHSEHTAQMFRDAGISAAHIDGETPSEVRKTVIEQFRIGKTRVLCNVDLISEGFDVPAMEAVILCRPTQSLTLHIQQSMRAMRPDAKNPEKTAIIIDHVGNVYRHGLPDEDRVWTLESKKKQKQEREITLRECPKCYQVYRPPAKVCQYCEYVFEVEQRTGPEQVKGDLAEIKELQRRLERQEVGRARDIRTLEEIALKRGYKLSWINKMAEIKRIKG